jgi:predicted lipoprotein with Yx(FWY)xxD motif
MDRATKRVLQFTGAALAVALLASACSSSAKPSGGATNAAGGGGGAASGGGASVTVETHSGPMGTYLTDGSGKALYMFAVDTATKSNCAGTCLTYWPPLTTSGSDKVSGAASMSKLTTISAGGGKQLVYAGHPLYYYKGDSAAGDTHGQGLNDFGGKWWLLAPSGQPISSSGSGAAASSSSSSSGGDSWG